MDTAQVAILISIVSALIAVFALGWNVYRDVVLKAKVVVTFAVKKIIGAGMPPSPDYVGISATNHGPGPVTLNSIVLRDYTYLKKLRKRHKYAYLMQDYTNPYSTKMPKQLEVGESVGLFVDYDKECFLKDSYTQLGVSDSFGRTNWASKKTMRELREKWLEDFGSNTDACF